MIVVCVDLFGNHIWKFAVLVLQWFFILVLMNINIPIANVSNDAMEFVSNNILKSVPVLRILIVLVTLLPVLGGMYLFPTNKCIDKACKVASSIRTTLFLTNVTAPNKVTEYHSAPCCSHGLCVRPGSLKTVQQCSTFFPCV